MNPNSLTDHLDDLARSDQPASPTPEQELEAWLKRPWPQISRRPASNDSDDTPSSLELP